MIMHICGDIDIKIRIGGKMKLKRVGSVFLATALTCSLAVTPVFADEIDDLKNQKEAVQNEVSSLQSQLNSIISKITELENQLIETGEEISQTEEDLKVAQEEEEQQYEAMKLRIKYMYENGSGTATMEKVLTSGDMSSMLTQAEYSQQVHDYDREKLEEYAATVQKVEDLQTSLKEKQSQLQQSQTEFEAQQDELDATIQEKSAEVEDLDAQIDEAVRKAAEEAARKAEEERKRQEEERKKQEEEARRQQEAQQNHNNSSNSSNESAEESGGSSNSNSNGSSGGSSSGSSSNSGSSNFVPDYNQSAGQIIVSAAYSQIGVPYVWGGSTPGVGLDCSGLVQWCYRQAGISIPRTSGDIRAAGTVVSNPQPGDICWKPGHVAIYIGNGQMIEAPKPGMTVRVTSVRVVDYIRF